jgi:large repetitive protein
MLHKTKAAVIAATVAMGVTLFGYLSYAAGGTYFTYVDNANDTNNLISPANTNTNTTPDNDMATNNLATMTETTAPNATYGSAVTIEFNISNTGAVPATSASLTVRAYDVDEEQGEQDDVYLNGHLLGKLTGANNVWSTTVFKITNLAWVTTGKNLVQVKPDQSGDATAWVVAVRWGQILIDGGAADKASTGAVKITGCQTRTANTVGCTVNGSVAAGDVQIDTQATINAVTAGNYRLEVSIIDPSGNSTSVLTDNFTATANSTITRTVSPTYTLSSATGTYTVQSQLFYIDSNSFPVQQDIATRQFQHVANQGPTDLDNDGLTNNQETTLGTSPTNTDTDGDGIADNVEVGSNVNAPTDTDGDGIIDALESNTVDTDGDGLVNSVDTDSDNDGIPDSVERGAAGPHAPVDTDGDGKPDYIDRDSDNDTIPDALEAGPTPATPVDTDNDGKKDYLDLDSDGDHLPDRIEGGGLGIDTDGDGIDNAFDVDTQGGTDTNHDGIRDGLLPRDTDGDGKADFREVDSDNDGILDRVETNLSNVDTDGDGIDNTIDVTQTGGVDANGDGIDDAYVLPDTDGDGIPDYRDLDSDRSRSGRCESRRLAGCRIADYRYAA